MQVNYCGNQLGLLSVKQPVMLFIIFYHKKWTTDLVRRRFQIQGESVGLFYYFFGLSIFFGQVRKPVVANTHVCQYPRLPIIE